MGKNFGDWMKRRMVEKDLTTRELARNVGMTEVRMNRILNGEREPYQAELSNILMALKMPKTEEKKMNTCGLRLGTLVRTMDPDAFVRVLLIRNGGTSTAEAIFDGEAQELLLWLRGYDRFEVVRIRLAADPDTVDSVMEITLAEN